MEVDDFGDVGGSAAVFDEVDVSLLAARWVLDSFLGGIIVPRGICCFCFQVGDLIYI